VPNASGAPDQDKEKSPAKSERSVSTGTETLRRLQAEKRKND
jgi:hypothetical protein